MAQFQMMEKNSVGRVGVEPTQPLGRRILSPLRLPIPPSPRTPNCMQSSKTVKEYEEIRFSSHTSCASYKNQFQSSSFHFASGRYLPQSGQYRPVHSAPP